MSKSKPKIKLEEFSIDLNNVLNLVSKIDNINIEKTDLNKLSKNIKKLSKSIKNKYKDLDTKK